MNSRSQINGFVAGIVVSLILSAVYKQPLCHIQGFMRSIATLLGVEIAVPDFSTLSRRGKGPTLPATRKTDRSDPVRSIWGLDLVSGESARADLTTNDVGDLTALPGLLDQIASPVAPFLAEGAYDDGPPRDQLAARFGAMIEVAISPPKHASPRPDAVRNPTARD